MAGGAHEGKQEIMVNTLIKCGGSYIEDTDALTIHFLACLPQPDFTDDDRSMMALVSSADWTDIQIDVEQLDQEKKNALERLDIRIRDWVEKGRVSFNREISGCASKLTFYWVQFWISDKTLKCLQRKQQHITRIGLS